MPERARSVLLLADDQRAHADTIHDHIQALLRLSRHRVHYHNPRGLPRSRHLDFRAYDAVVVHYSIILADDTYLSPWYRAQLAAFEGLTIQFIQDEYRWVDRLTEQMRFIGVDVLFSLVAAEQLERVYSDRLPGVRIVPTLAGYVPDGIVGRSSPPPEARRIDVGYRARPIPYWLGSLGQEKIQIAERFLEVAPTLGLRTDIAWSEDSRLYGRRWHRFLASSRTTLGVESGASIADHDGSVERKTVQYLAEHPMASFEEVFDAVLAPHEGNATINVLSPRVFEAAAFRSGLVLFPGEYSGIIEPERHYIPLEKDFSNLDEVATRIRDSRYLRELTGRTYDDLIGSHRYAFSRLAADFDRIVDEEAPLLASGARHPRVGLKLEELRRGRSYAVSYAYMVARRVVHRSKELQLLAREPSARRLLSSARGSRGRLWPDAVRLALLASAQRGRLDNLGDRFVVAPSWQPDAGRLVLSSRPTTEHLDPAAIKEVRRDIEEALRRGELHEIVWSHVDDTGVVWFPYGPKKLAFEVGRRGSYGVHEFQALTELALTHPLEVADALDPVLAEPELRS